MRLHIIQLLQYQSFLSLYLVWYSILIMFKIIPFLSNCIDLIYMSLLLFNLFLSLFLFELLKLMLLCIKYINYRILTHHLIVRLMIALIGFVLSITLFFITIFTSLFTYIHLHWRICLFYYLVLFLLSPRLVHWHSRLTHGHSRLV